MVMKYFEELERNGYRYRNPEASDAPSKERRILDSIAFLSNHVHMPDGTPRYFPVIYERAPQYKEGRLEYVKVTVDSVGPSLSNQRYNVRIKIGTLPTHYTDDEIKKMDDLAKSVANASIERLAEILKIATVESVEGTFNHSFENVENGDVVMLKSVGQKSLTEGNHRRKVR